jgi:hypothetical protein
LRTDAPGSATVTLWLPGKTVATALLTAGLGA